MTITAAELQDMRDALVRARATGARRAKVGSEEVEFASAADLESAIAFVERQIADAEGRTAPRVIFVHQAKG